MDEVTEFRQHRFYCRELIVNGQKVEPAGDAPKPSGKIENINCTTWTDSGDKVEDTINAMLGALREHGIIAK